LRTDTPGISLKTAQGYQSQKSEVVLEETTFDCTMYPCQESIGFAAHRVAIGSWLGYWAADSAWRVEVFMPRVGYLLEIMKEPIAIVLNTEIPDCRHRRLARASEIKPSQ
jgi:hypothetical protein